MVFLRSLFCLVTFLPWFGGGADQVQTDKWEGRPLVVRVDTDDLSDARRVRELERLLERADSEDVSGIVLRWSLAGPTRLETVERVLGFLGDGEAHRISFVEDSATGPAALLALAADKLFLAPGAVIGGAAPLFEENERAGEAGEDSGKQRFQQDVSILRARARSLSARHGYRSAVIEAMIDGSRSLVLDGRELSSEGEVLTLTASEALESYEGKPLLGDGLADTIEDVLRVVSLEGEPIETTPREFGENENRKKLRSSQDSEKSNTDADEPSERLFGKREESSFEGKVIVVEVGQDTLATGKAAFEFMDRTLKKAELEGAAAVIFDMDTPGGIAWYTDSLVLDTLQNVTFPTITFVNPRAESAGSIVAVGTDHIYMRPAATIGSALVVSSTGQDLSESLNDKVTQMIIGTVRNVAELKGHNPDVAEAFVTRDKEVRIAGTVVHEAGSVLNLNTIRATEIIGGRPVLAKGVATSINEILEKEGIVGEITVATPLGMEAFAHWVQKLSVLLIVVGIAGAYMELNSPGFGLPGLVSVLAFSVFFFGNYFAGNLAGYELAVLLVLGVVLIAIEIFLFPGAILPGAVGGALVLVSLGLAMVDKVDLEWKWNGFPGAESWLSLFRGSLLALAIGLAGALVAIFAGMRFLPETRLGQRFVLAEAVARGASLGKSEEEKTEEGRKELVGWEGESLTDLVPSGKGRFGDVLLDIVSDGQFIRKGTPIRVMVHEGSRIVVEAIV